MFGPLTRTPDSFVCQAPDGLGVISILEIALVSIVCLASLFLSFSLTDRESGTYERRVIPE